MPQFRVTLTDTKQGGAVTHDGYLTKHVKFLIQRLSDRKMYSYEGHGGGERFNLRCQLLATVGGVLVEAEDSESAVPGTAWRELVVNRALEEAESLQ